MPGICSCITAPITVPINCRYHCSSMTRAITDLRPETTASAPHFGTMYSGRRCADDLGPQTGHRDSPPVHAGGLYFSDVERDSCPPLVLLRPRRRCPKGCEQLMLPPPKFTISLTVPVSAVPPTVPCPRIHIRSPVAVTMRPDYRIPG